MTSKGSHLGEHLDTVGISSIGSPKGLPAWTINIAMQWVHTGSSLIESKKGEAVRQVVNVPMVYCVNCHLSTNANNPRCGSCGKPHSVKPVAVTLQQRKPIQRYFRFNVAQTVH